jgi:nucleoside diphosphate kinase
MEIDPITHMLCIRLKPDVTSSSLIGDIGNRFEMEHLTQSKVDGVGEDDDHRVNRC